MHLSDQTQFLDRGDGTCRHFNEDNLLCTIYNNRPDICRVDLQYETVYSKQFSWPEFVELNLEACRRLQDVT